jgi:hypothetical protein
MELLLVTVLLWLLLAAGIFWACEKFGLGQPEKGSRG